MPIACSPTCVSGCRPGWYRTGIERVLSWVRFEVRSKYFQVGGVNRLIDPREEYLNKEFT